LIAAAHVVEAALDTADFAGVAEDYKCFEPGEPHDFVDEADDFEIVVVTFAVFAVGVVVESIVVAASFGSVAAVVSVEDTAAHVCFGYLVGDYIADAVVNMNFVVSIAVGSHFEAFGLAAVAAADIAFAVVVAFGVVAAAVA